MNAKEEFIKHVQDRMITCAIITYGSEWSEEGISEVLLKVRHTPQEYKEFLESLNFDYDSGYGGQNLFGTIWYTDGTWSSRGEYDGSEWWEYNECPEIPKELE